MAMEPKNKYITFKRKHVMDFAKTIRNSKISENSRLIIARDLASYLETIDPFFARQQFMMLVLGRIDHDYKTEVYSKVELKNAKV